MAGPSGLSGCQVSPGDGPASRSVSGREERTVQPSHRLSARRVGECLDPVAIRINNERRVIVGIVVGPDSGRAIVTATGLQCGCVECINTPAAGRGQTEMQSRFQIGWNRPLARADPEYNVVLTVTEGGLSIAQALVTQRLQRRIV